MKRRPPPLPRRRPGRGNALLGWELLRVSRRTGAIALSRFAFGGALLGIMWLLWTVKYSDKTLDSGSATAIAAQLSQFAQSFAITFFMVQLAIVLLLTPIFVGGSVFEERETRSGEVLLTTDLTRREIFYGKYLARVVQVMMVVMAGIPVLALTFLWGGVAPEFILVGYVCTFFCIVSSGAIAASVAGGAETFRQAILKAYGYGFVFNCVIIPGSPFLVIFYMGTDTLGGAVCFGVVFLVTQILVTILSLGYGLRWLRLAMLRQRKRITPELAERMIGRRPPLPQDAPLFWKEKFVSGHSKTVDNAVLATCTFIVAISGIFVVLTQHTPGGWHLHYVVPLLLFGAAANLGIGAASGIAIERQKNTLIDLFMIPGSRSEILVAKLMGAFWRARWSALMVFVAIPLGFLNGSPLVALPVVAIACCAYLCFAGALGVWLSIRCRTALVANAVWIGAVTLGLIGTFLVADAASERKFANNRMTKEMPAWGPILNPGLALAGLAMTSDEQQSDVRGNVLVVRKLHVIPPSPPALLAPFAGVILYTGMGGLFWFLALRRFNREGRED